MARYYKGAGVGTFWHANDARLAGFTPAAGGRPASTDTIKDHIVNQLVKRGPYISLTRSWEIAECFATYGGNIYPTKTSPAYVYVIDIPNSSAASLIDPVQELAAALGTLFASQSYQHDGGQDVILGLADSANFGHVLARPIRMQGNPTGQGPAITRDLHAFVRALRDAEILVKGAIPKNCVTDRIDVS
jgi:hypothetical protein